MRITNQNVPFLLNKAVFAERPADQTVIGAIPERWLVGDAAGESWAIPVYKVHKGGSRENPTYQFLYTRTEGPGLAGIPLTVTEKVSGALNLFA